MRAVTIWCLIAALRRSEFASPLLSLRSVHRDKGESFSTTTGMRRELGIVSDKSTQFRLLSSVRFVWPNSSHSRILWLMLLSAGEAAGSTPATQPSKIWRRSIEHMNLLNDYSVSNASDPDEVQLIALRSVLCAVNPHPDSPVAGTTVRFFEVLTVAVWCAKVIVDDKTRQLGKHLSCSAHRHIVT